METVDAFDMRVGKHAVFDHRLRAAAAFFSRLEAEHDRAAQKIAAFHDHLGRAQQYRHVSVVAAGVHGSAIDGSKAHLASLFHRQTVHVRAQQDRAPWFARAKYTDHAGPTDAGPDFVSERLEPLGDDARGPNFFESQLGMHVEIAAHRDDVIHQTRGYVEHVARHHVILSVPSRPRNFAVARRASCQAARWSKPKRRIS